MSHEWALLRSAGLRNCAKGPRDHKSRDPGVKVDVLSARGLSWHVSFSPADDMRLLSFAILAALTLCVAHSAEFGESPEGTSY